jgi:hypothetical protein
VESASRQLRIFVERRRQLVVESAVAVAVGAGLFAVAPAIESQAPLDVQALYVCVCVLSAVCGVSLVSRLVPALLFRCPRCRELFHGRLPRALFLLPRLRSCCSHCGLGTGPAEAESPAA